jgi:hypothetical protein
LADRKLVLDSLEIMNKNQSETVSIPIFNLVK